MRQKRRSYREPDDDDEDAIGEDLAAVNERLDNLTRQLERMAQANVAPRPEPAVSDARPPDRVAEALARLDRRLDEVIHESRTVARQPQYAPLPPPPPQHAVPPPAAPKNGPANWAAQISARQRALDGRPALAAPAPPQQFAPPPPQPAQPAQATLAPWGPGPDLTGLEHQLRQINDQISSLQQPYERALGALRGEIAEIGRALTEAMPRRAIEALEAEVRALAERVDRTRQAGADGAALGTLERELAEVRDALRGLTPAESLVGFEDAVRALSHKIDQIAASAQAPQDPMAFRQLEQAVVSLRGIVSNVASDGALAQLAAEVRGLASQFERATADSSTEALAKLEARIAALMESGRAVPPELEGSIRALSERLDHMQLSQGDQLALGALEDRIAKLSEKLDASDKRLNHLDAIERGLADLLVYLDEMRSNGGPRGLRAAPPAEPTRTPAAPPRPAPAAPAQAPAPTPAPAFAQSPLDLIPDAPQEEAPPIAAPMPQVQPQPSPQPPPAQPVAIVAPPPAPLPERSVPTVRRPIDPNLPPDTPLEPGSGVPRVKPGSAAARIAASEAALANPRPATAETGMRSAAIAAARSAAKAAYLDTPVKVPKSLAAKSGSRFKWPFSKAIKAPPAPQLQMPQLPPIPAATPVQMPPPMPVPVEDVAPAAPLSRGKRVLKVLKTILIAASVAIIVIGAAQMAMDLLFPSSTGTPETQAPSGETNEAPNRPPATAPVPPRPMPSPSGALPVPPAADPDTTGQIGRSPSFFDPTTVITPTAPHADVTGSIARKPAPRTPNPATPSPAAATSGPIGATLQAAAAANEPGALYEMGSRYAEGRGVPQNLPEAARWLERAASAGFAPAQFRLASLNEKGDGIKKDVQAARRLYLAAAEKGHAKAMHNLAVLYAEGIDGKPNYKVAAEWFRKAAGYGVTDSQYNLAILYARGIGVAANLPESYRWFALAAAKGDGDAAKKRDEVAARLDAQSLAAAKLAVQTFVPEREPDEATSLKAPPGGWDHTPAAPVKPRRQAPASTAH